MDNVTRKPCIVCGEVFPATPEFFYESHPGKLRNQCKSCYLVSRPSTYFSNYYQTHKEERAAYQRQRLPFRRLSNQAYKARKRSLPNTLTYEDWQRALVYFNGCCAVCGKPLTDDNVSADHWQPLKSPDCPGTVPKNILPLCRGVGGCNTSKREADPRQWLEYKFGKKRAREIWRRVHFYFASLK